MLICLSNYCLAPSQVPVRPAAELLHVPFPELLLNCPTKLLPRDPVPTVAKKDPLFVTEPLKVWLSPLALVELPLTAPFKDIVAAQIPESPPE